MSRAKKHQKPSRSALYYGTLLGMSILISDLMLFFIFYGGKAEHHIVSSTTSLVSGLGIFALIWVLQATIVIYILRLACLAYKARHACLPFNAGLNMVVSISTVAAVYAGISGCVGFLFAMDMPMSLPKPNSTAWTWIGFPLLGGVLSFVKMGIYLIFIGAIVVFFMQKKPDDTQFV